ncbi:MAG: type II secretion system protein M [Sinobacteraceae bacterium]|nr:type II secretion system protein M [Nevskiaceae bacterium]
MRLSWPTPLIDLGERVASRYAQLSLRDRRALALGATAVTLIPLLALMFHVTERNWAAQGRIADKRSVLQQWNAHQPQWQASGLAGVPIDLSLQQRLEAARSAAGLSSAAFRVTEQAPRTVLLQLDAADFASIVALLAQMSAEGVSIESVELAAAASPGAVSGTLLLRGP